MADRTASARVARLLALVPYILTHQGVTFAEASREFGISEAQLKDDLNLIFVSGLPGYTPLELIDVVMDTDSIYIRNADVISKPMRLGVDEALSLLLGLKLIEPLAPEEVSALKEKIGQATTVPIEEVAARFQVIEQPVAPLVNEALVRNRRLLIDYYVPARDEVTTREIDPLGVALVEGQTYVRAYCRLSESLRLFRLDRIYSAKIVDRPAMPPADEQFDEIRIEAEERVVMEIQPSVRWLIDHLHAELVQENPLTISAALANPEFFARLAVSLPDQILVISPPQVVEAIREKARRGLAHYLNS